MYDVKLIRIYCNFIIKRLKKLEPSSYNWIVGDFISAYNIVRQYPNEMNFKYMNEYVYAERAVEIGIKEIVPYHVWYERRSKKKDDSK